MDKDFVAIAVAYARRAASGHTDFGKWSRLACERFLRDLERAKRPDCPFMFDKEHANNACAFIELLPHVEGTWDTVNITLDPSHVFVTVNLFGFRNRDDDTRRFSTGLLAVARKNAKALALDTPIPTPDGWSTMGNLRIGDAVFAPTGKPTRVVGVSEVFTDHTCYRVTFKNGESVIADAGHLWVTSKGTLETERLQAALPAFVETTTPLEGNATSNVDDTYWMGFYSKGALRQDYLRADKATRVALLQGLMDALGMISSDGHRLQFRGENREQSSSFIELLSTLGLKCTPLPTSDTVPEELLGTTVEFACFRNRIEAFRDPARLRKMRGRSRFSGATKIRQVQIRSVVEVPSTPVRCIMVDSEDHQFLFGRTMLPTHNSTWAAGVMLYCQTCENEEGPQVISAATTGSQARIIFEIARKMALKSTDLREAFDLTVRSNDIQSHANNGIFKPINAKASSQDGLNPSATAIDEVHAHKTHDLLNVLKSAAGARKNPLFLYTTTEGYESPGPWPELRHFSKQVLQDVLVADHFFCIIYCLDTEDSEFDPSVWVKANPLMGANPLLAKEIAKEAVEAKQMPGKHAEFKIKRCNRQSAVVDGFIDIIRWDQQPDPFDDDSLIGLPCYAALDLASTRDLCSLRLTFERPDGHVFTIGRRWAPESAIKQRTERGTSNYAGWVEAGYLIQTPGDVTDYEFIEKEIVILHEKFNIVCLAYDKWNAGDLINRLVAKGINCREFIQGTKSYHPAMRKLERTYIAGKLHHGGDPLLKWCASNLVVRFDSNMNCAPDKKKSADKIDDVAALIMAMGAHLVDCPEVVAEPKLFFV